MRINLIRAFTDVPIRTVKKDIRTRDDCASVYKRPVGVYCSCLAIRRHKCWKGTLGWELWRQDIKIDVFHVWEAVNASWGATVPTVKERKAVFRGLSPALRAPDPPSLARPSSPRQTRPCLWFSFFSLVCGQDVAVMEYPRWTEMNQGLGRLTCTRTDPLFFCFAPFNARELSGSLPGARPQRFTNPQLPKHGEKSQRNTVQLYRPDIFRF